MDSNGDSDRPSLNATTRRDVQDNIIGVIYVDSRKLGPAFTAMDIQILEALADYTASVLVGALLHRKSPPAIPPADKRLVAELQQRIAELLPAV